MLRQNIFKRKPRKNRKKRKKESLLKGGGELCQGFLEKIFAYILYEKIFFQKHEVLDLYTIWRLDWEAP